MNRNQLGQYWKCLAQDSDTICPGGCDRCTICKEMNYVFVELRDFYFFSPKTTPANNEEPKPDQPVFMACIYEYNRQK